MLTGSDGMPVSYIPLDLIVMLYPNPGDSSVTIALQVPLSNFSALFESNITSVRLEPILNKVSSVTCTKH